MRSCTRARSSGGIFGMRPAMLEPLPLAVGIDAGPVALERRQRVALRGLSSASAARLRLPAHRAGGAATRRLRQDAGAPSTRQAQASSTARTPARGAGFRRAGSCRASWPSRSLARRRLQELDEAGVAVGGRRQVVGQQRGVDLGGGGDLRASSCQSLDQRPGRATSATSGSTDATARTTSPNRRRAAQRRDAPTPTGAGDGGLAWRAGAGALERLLAREAQALGHVVRRGRRRRSLRRAAMRSAKRACRASRAGRCSEDGC